MAAPAHPTEPGPPSAWVQRWAAGLAPGSTVLDLACGAGRHVHWLAGLGLKVTAVDRDTAAIEGMRGWPGVTEAVAADIEDGPWPFAGRQFDAIVITNYLWRPLWPTLLGSLSPGGWLIHETFNIDQAAIGKPSNPKFLLRRGELLEVAQALRVVAFEDGFLTSPERHVQRIAAVRESPGGVSAPPLRHPL